MSSVVSLNVVFAEVADVGGSVGVTAIDKRPVQDSRLVTQDGIQGDFRSDMKHHGSYDHAVYAYASEDYAWWEQELNAHLAPGTFGENFTTKGMDWTNAIVGTVVSVGSAQLQISGPRIPCGTFGRWMQQEQWVKRFTQAGRSGAYLRVLKEGLVEQGEQIVVKSVPDHGVTILDYFMTYNGDRDQARLIKVANCPDIDQDTRAKAQAFM